MSQSFGPRFPYQVHPHENKRMRQFETRYPGSWLAVEALVDAAAQSEPCNDHKVATRHDQDVN